MNNKVYALKNCPFCGGKADINNPEDEDGFYAIIYIYCEQCHAKTDDVYFHITYNDFIIGSDSRKKYEHLAVDNWNKRSNT